MINFKERIEEKNEMKPATSPKRPPPKRKS